MGIKIALTGASGNMGIETLSQLMELDFVSKVKVLLLKERKEIKFSKIWKKKYKDKIEIIFGNIKDIDVVKELINGVDYVLNLAAVIPPTSDHYPNKAIECNVVGVKNIVDTISSINLNQPKLVHISSVAIYGNRNYKHPYGRVGDPLLPSVYDVYSSTKLKGERIVLDSEITNWVILRQTGILYSKMLFNNIKDGLMFHTCYNAPIEWVTAFDSGLLLKNLIYKDYYKTLDSSFWKKCYNIGGGEKNRITGFDIFDLGFRIIGGSTEKFLKPEWNSIRNFHCMWFLDSDVLNNYFDFQKEDVNKFWEDVLNSHKYFKLAKLLPPKLISKLVIERLLNDENSPKYWINSKQEGKVKAYFGSKDNISCLPKKWEDFPILKYGKVADGDIDYESIKDINKAYDNGFILDHGYDESKPDSKLDIIDMQEAAKFRGGKCLSTSMVKGDLYTKLLWECHDGHKFYSSPYTILKAGHWCSECCEPEPWDYDRLSKFMPFYAQVYYDTHAKGENTKYYYDSNYNAKYKSF